VDGRSFRLFKPEELRAKSGEKKPVYLTLEVREVEFAESVNKLRVSGKILAGSPEEFVSLGSHHTLDVEIDSTMVLRKHAFGQYHLKMLEEARKKAKKVNALVILMDEEQAALHKLSSTGAKFLCEISNKASKRDAGTYEELRKKFFSDAFKKISEENAEKIILAGPGFTVEDFRKYAVEKSPALAKKIILEHASTSEQSGVRELMKRGVISRLITGYRLEEEFLALEELKKNLAKETGLACSGIENVKKAVEYNAVSKLLVLDEVLRKEKEADEIVSQAVEKGADVLMFDSGDDAGAEFKHFKIAAFLRFKAF